MPNFGKPWRFWRFFQWEKTTSTAGNGGNIPHKIPQKIQNKNYESPKIEVFWNWYKWGKYSFLAMFEWRCSFTNCWRLSFLLQFCTMYELGESGFPNSDFVWWLKDWRKTWEWRNTWVVHPQELEFVNIWSFKFPIPHRQQILKQIEAPVLSPQILWQNLVSGHDFALEPQKQNIRRLGLGRCVMFDTEI